MIYMIRAGDAGPIKIGKAHNARRRMATFQTAHYETLTFLRILPGYTKEETWFRRHYLHLHIRGEWHHPCPSMLTVQPNVEEGVGNLPLMPLRLVTNGLTGTALLRSQRGALAHVAEALGFTKSAVSQWKAIPTEYVVTVERVTGLPREHLCPDLYRGPYVPAPLMLVSAA